METRYRRTVVSPEMRLRITLRIMTEAKYWNVVTAFRVQVSTIYHIFHDTCKVLQPRLHLTCLPSSHVFYVH